MLVQPTVCAAARVADGGSIANNVTAATTATFLTIFNHKNNDQYPNQNKTISALSLLPYHADTLRSLPHSHSQCRGHRPLARHDLTIIMTLHHHACN